MKFNDVLAKSPMGKEIEYPKQYDPSLLYAIPRQLSRETKRMPCPSPFHGADIWNAYEISWLNAKGKPCVALGEFIVPCESAHIFESKSFKLYLNSFNQHLFQDETQVRKTLENDLSQATGALVQVKLFFHEQYNRQIEAFSGNCLDDLDVSVDTYHHHSDYLRVQSQKVFETLYSHLLKSNCPVTGQPDWASVWIEYEGSQIDREGLLKYIISLRSQQEFHESCVEGIFIDILEHCKPEKLSVYGRYTRRGGIDINPFRSNFKSLPSNIRLARQ